MIYVLTMMQFLELTDKGQTVREIKRISKKYSGDLEKFIVRFKSGYSKLSNLDKNKFFEFIKKIKYTKDLSPVEIVLRPKIVLENIAMGADCKKKTLICCSYFEKNGIKYRLVGSSKRDDGKIHHIFPQIFENGKWCNFDATYNHYRLNEPKIVSKAEIL
jgi:hypothetical protein